MTSATIKRFLPHGDAKRLRVGEVSNWTGKELAAPRTELEDLLSRDELESSGIYFLLGFNPDSGAGLAYIGEAEVIRDRLKQHMSKDFWSSVVVFVSKDENLTKAHIRYSENRILQEAKAIGRYALENTNSSSPKLPQSDREDMEVCLSRIRQVMPVLGSDLLSPISGSTKPVHPQPELVCKIKSALARGRRTESGSVVFGQSTGRPCRSALRRKPGSEHGCVAQQADSRDDAFREGRPVRLRLGCRVHQPKRSRCSCPRWQCKRLDGLEGRKWKDAQRPRRELIY
jgi:hypothetical protein